MEDLERRTRRDAFRRSPAEADDYAAARPEYPAEVLVGAAELAGLRRGSDVLEVGCGTGQATSWMGSLGCRVLAIDLSATMVDVARRRLRGTPDVEGRRADFEALPVEPRFDALLFATSYHWLDPSDRASRSAGHLRTGGALILLWHVHPTPYTGFHEAVQPIYERLVPGRESPAIPGMKEEGLARILAEIEATGMFGPVARRSHDWARGYARDEYLRLMSTYSDHRLLPDGVRAQLFDEVSALIDRDFAGRVERPYRTELFVAERR